MNQVDASREWLEPDGWGGFASGTAGLERTRRYHALLLAAAQPPLSRFVLVNGLEAWIETHSGKYAISTQHYAPDIRYPDGAEHIARFTANPWPRWEFRLGDRTLVEWELFVPSGRQAIALCWRILESVGPATLRVRMLFSGRDLHALHHENPAFRFDAHCEGRRLAWRPYQGRPGVAASHNGRYLHEPVWYRNFLYTEEKCRGLDCHEDLASPGVLEWSLTAAPAVLLLEATDTAVSPHSLVIDEGETGAPLARYNLWRAREQRRRERFPSRLDRAADAYMVRRGLARSVIAGYPWFTDWGRDSLIGLRGLCLATGRLDQARDILLAWAGVVSQGLLPNRFPERYGGLDYSSVDTSLWYIVAAHDYWQACRAAGETPPADERARLVDTADEILEAYAAGTRLGIRLDADALLAAGEPGTALTWMDARVGDRAVTPRIGKPVEVQALWLNALWIAGQWTDRWHDLLERGRASFAARFMSESGSLHDVVDVNHVSGTVDSSLRPNQIFAVGGLPLALLEGEPARRVVEIVEQELWTPIGLRTLSRHAPGYCPRYEGGVQERDIAYHQGTVWPWLAGPFVEAWVRVRDGTETAKRQARARFLAPLLAYLDQAGWGHLPEIADAEPPHTPRGCPFQAWSVGEALRLKHVVLAESAPPSWTRVRPSMLAGVR